MNPTVVDKLLDFPMGPNVRMFLDLSGLSRPQKIASKQSDEAEILFRNVFLEKLTETEVKTSDALTDLVEELVGMDYPDLAVKLIESFPNRLEVLDFRAQFSAGNAVMLAGELNRAEYFFAQANRCSPTEPAPYVNLSSIYLAQGALDAAYSWAQAGLRVEANNPKLWESLYRAASAAGQKGQALGEQILSFATQIRSWAGGLLALEVLDPENYSKRLDWLSVLEKFYARDVEFLVQYTALLGMLGQYDTMADTLGPIFDSIEGEDVWRLKIHYVQALLSLDKFDLARESLEKIAQDKELNESALQTVEELRKELSDFSH